MTLTPAMYAAAVVHDERLRVKRGEARLAVEIRNVDGKETVYWWWEYPNGDKLFCDPIDATNAATVQWLGMLPRGFGLSRYVEDVGWTLTKSIGFRVCGFVPSGVDSEIEALHAYHLSQLAPETPLADPVMREG